MSGPLAVAVQVTGQTTTAVALTVANIVGVAVLAGIVAGCVAVAYRWYVREPVATGLALLAGLAVVAVSLSTTSLLANELAPDGPDIELVTALVHVAAFLTSGLSAYAGTRFGDRFGVNLFAATGTGDVDADVSEIVQTVGRVTSVQLPDQIADVVGYDPVSEATKETLAGRRFLFPRRLTKAELRDRLVSRLKTDYGVGHVDVEFGDDGSVEFLAIGSRAAGIGPTLPPATNAVAIRADPAHAASAGDLVQVWETDPMKRVLTGELRGAAGDVVTVAIDAAETPKLSPSERYKLVTLPVQDRPDREFASLLRAADETLATVTVEAGSDLDGVTLDSLDVTIAAITREDDRPEPLPVRSRPLHAGDVVYAIATPEILRKIENAARGPEGVVSSAPSDSRPPESETGPPESDPGPVETDPEPADPDPEQADLDDGSRGDDGTTPDWTPVEEPDSDDDTDRDPLSGDAFTDVGDLPGNESDVTTPTVPDERSDRSSDQHPDDERDDAATDEDDAAPEEPGSIDDALDSMESLDLDGEAVAEEAGESVDETGNDDPLDDVAAGESGDDAADDAVPFTPLDVGDDDPLADPLTGADGDEDDDVDDSGRERGN